MSSQPSRAQVAILKAALFAAALAPLAKLLAGVLYFPEWLGANPAEFVTRSTGDWTLRFLLLTLAVTPLRRLTGWNWVLRLRRMLGLYAFFYGVMHASSYAGFDQLFDFAEILADIAKRPFITVGFGALLLMLPLAVTSTNAMVRRLGGARWQALHRLIYLIAPLGVLHFWWMVKRDLRDPAIYAVLLAALLAYRIAVRLKPMSPSRRGTAVQRGSNQPKGKYEYRTP
jgi:sulfoxide reductase heme-binding subunit YedZ